MTHPITRHSDHRKSVLIVADSYSFGGLETHINGEIVELDKQGWDVHIACANISVHDTLPKCLKSITLVPGMGSGASLSDLVEAIDALSKIINENAVSIVHAHPFLSIVPSYIASSKLQVPFVITLHGPSSLDGSIYGECYGAILGHILHDSHVVTVSNELSDLFLNKIKNNPNIKVIPNSVAPTKDPALSGIKNIKATRWLYISRLDEYKVVGLKKLLRILSDIGVEEIDIVGDGPSRQMLDAWIAKTGLRHKVRLLGHHNQASNDIPQYDCVAGMGRVVLEAIAARRPVCLVGYDGVKGFISTKKGLLEAVTANFSGRNMKSINKEKFLQDYANVSLGSISSMAKLLLDKYNQKSTWAVFTKYIASAKPPANGLGIIEALAKSGKDSTAWLASIDFLNIIKSTLDDTPRTPSSQSRKAEVDLSDKGIKHVKQLIPISIARQVNMGKGLSVPSPRVVNRVVSIFASRLARNDTIIDAEHTAVVENKNEHYDLIANSDLFDKKYYLEHNKDVADSGIEPIAHYLLFGGFEGRKPSDLFDTAFYGYRYADYIDPNMNPLVHYLLYGKNEGRQIVQGSRLVKQRNVANTQKKVDIVNVNFYDWSGKTLYKGGAERYVYDLACVIKKLGCKVRIIQNATLDFKRTYRGIEVVGIKTNEVSLRGISKGFKNVCSDADLVIASPVDLACELDGINTIGISHGIHWDHTNRRIYSHTDKGLKEVFDALLNTQKVVCVDTNFINWVRTYDFELSQKLTYIPNYFDKNEFKPYKKDFSQKIVVLYPRRLYAARGIYITLEAFDTVLKKYEDLELHLVGQTDDTEVLGSVEKLIAKFPSQVSLREYSMEDMPKAYKNSHIVLIPTVHSEGTSLSCLEAMATNNALIVTTVGGLPNLVVEGHNGLMVDPNSESIIRAIDVLMNDRRKMAMFAQNSVQLADAFEKRKWDDRWAVILEKEL